MKKPYSVHDDVLVGTIDHDICEAFTPKDAQRIAACLNACRFHKTEELDSCGDIHLIESRREEKWG